MSSAPNYPIGIPGQPWEIAHKTAWLGQQCVKRSYNKQVIRKFDNYVDRTGNYDIDNFDVERYGALQPAPGAYPLLAFKTRPWDNNKPCILITGGVHGYETSGVQGAIRFLQKKAVGYKPYFNILVVPCVSPWSYETINRWNHRTIDPNRSFTENVAYSPSEEAAKLMIYIDDLGIELMAHFDLHETTDTDNSEFRPAMAARDGVTLEEWGIPDGFYLVGNSEKPVADFQQAIITGVKQVTHIAPADNTGKIIGVATEQEGVINYQAAKLGLCMGFTSAPYVTTTEVYPDSPLVDDENCIIAQVTAITSGLDYLIGKHDLKADIKPDVKPDVKPGIGI